MQFTISLKIPFFWLFGAAEKKTNLNVNEISLKTWKKFIVNHNFSFI